MDIDILKLLEFFKQYGIGGILLLAFFALVYLLYKSKAVGNLFTKFTDLIIERYKKRTEVELKVKELESNIHNNTDVSVTINDKLHWFKLYNFFYKADMLKFYVYELIKNTDVDRISFLFATNGSTEINYVYMPLQWLNFDEPLVEKSIGIQSSYYAIPIDDVYRKMIKTIDNEPYYDLVTEMEENSLLKNYYIQEGVLISRISKITEEFDGDVRGLYFLSLASHTVNKWSDNDKFHMEMFINRIRILFKI